MDLKAPFQTPKSLSLRDPDGCLFQIDSQLIRQIQSKSKSNWSLIKNSPTLKSFIERGLFVKSWELTEGDILKLSQSWPSQFKSSQSDFFVRQEKIPFVSYPYEWAPEMLKAAGLLTLDLAIALNEEELGLKDATPFNILFSGCKPIFVDLLSLEKRDPKDSLWIAYSQFSQTFMNPLLAYQHLGIPLVNTFLLSREGLTASVVYSHSSIFRKLSPSFLGQITFPAWLETWNDRKLSHHPDSHQLTNPEQAKFTLNFFLKSVRNKLNKLTFNHRLQRTQFKNYMGADSPYTKERFEQKEKIVAEWLKDYSNQSVLDVGCNDGHFSRMAADLGRKVVAIDSETELISKTWESCRTSHPSILPLVINIANPSPATGWKSEEFSAFMQRSQGHFDCVLMLAVIHHLLTTESILLPHILDLAKELTTDHLILEWVETSDPMFQHLSKGRNYDHLTSTYFEEQCSLHFDIKKKERLPGNSRILYALKRKSYTCTL